MDKGHFLLRHTRRNQFGADIVIDIEGAVILRRGEITEEKLCQPFLFSLLPDPQYIGDTGVDFTSGIIRKQRIHQPLIQSQLPAVRGDFKHIVHGRIHHTTVDCRSPFRQFRHHGLLVLRRLNHHSLKFCLRYWQVQLVAGFNICDFLKHGHQFREIKKLRKPRPCPVSGSLRSQLNSRSRLSKSGRPAVKMCQTFLPKGSILKITHDRIKLRHGVADGRTCGKYHAAPSGQFIHIAAFQEHIL